MSELKVISTILCDDVRQELNGKYILIGVYSGGINFNNPLPIVKRSLFVFSLTKTTSRRLDLEYRVVPKRDGEALLTGKTGYVVNENVEVPTDRPLDLELVLPILALV